jgi:hypothetical protein
MAIGPQFVSAHFGQPMVQICTQIVQKFIYVTCIRTGQDDMNTYTNLICPAVHIPMCIQTSGDDTNIVYVLPIHNMD